MSAYASVAFLRPVNSLMSAPATKPLAFADLTMTARGRSAVKELTSVPSSASTFLESTLALTPGLSRISHAMSSASRSSFQADASSFILLRPVTGPMSGRRAARSSGGDVEVAHERAVIRETHIGHPELRNFDARAHEDEVELDAR